MAPAGDSGSGEDLAVGGGACVLLVVAVLGANQTSNTAPIIAGSVAIIVALVTWYATDKRQSRAIRAQEEQQERALQAERDRHRAALAAEADRHAARLRHEERQQDIEELRRVLDATMGALAAELEAHAEARDAWRGDEHVPKRLDDALKELASSLRRVNTESYRLSLRMGDSHDAIRALGDMYTAAEAQREVLQREEPSEEARARLREHGEAVAAALVAFRTAAFREIQVRREAE